MASKAKKSTIKFKQKRQHAKNKARLGPSKGKGKPGKAGKHGAPWKRSASREERQDEGKKIAEQEMDVDAFLDQDFGPGGDAGEDHSESGESDNESLSSLEEDDLNDDVDILETPSGEEASGKKRKVSEVESHQKTLDSLRTKDPEFYEYLQQTDSNLLDFEDSDDEEGDSSDSESEQQAELSDGKTKKVIVIDAKTIQGWCEAAESSASLKATHNLLKAYRIGCHYGDDDTDVVSKAFKISSSTVFNKLMLYVLRNADRLFRRALNLESSKPEAVKKALSSSKWKKLGPLVKSYFGNTLHLLGQITERALVGFILQRLRASIDLFTKFPILNKKLLKSSLVLFGSDLGESTADRTVRIQSVLVVRSLALAAPDAFADACMKGIYRTYQSCAKFVKARSLQSLHFMQDCIAEVYAVNPDAAYKQAFLSLRELAILLRKALNTKTKDSYLQVYSWQTITALDLWERVVSKHGSHERAPLYPLVYPLTQILLGTAQLISTTRYLPLRFHVVRTLNRLAKNTGVYIPVTSLIVEALNFSELSKKPSGVGNSRQFDGLLKVSKTALRTTSFQDGCVGRVVLLLSDHLSQWAYHIAFPELAFPVTLQLKKFVKSCQVEKFKRRVRQLVEAVERNSDYILAARQKVEFSPKDTDRVKQFAIELESEGRSPLVKFFSGVRKQMEEQEASAKTEVVYLKDSSAKNKERPDSVDLSDEDEALDYDQDVINKVSKGKSRNSDDDDDDDVHGNGIEHEEKEDRVEDFEMNSESDSESEQSGDDGSDEESSSGGDSSS